MVGETRLFVFILPFFFQFSQHACAYLCTEFTPVSVSCYSLIFLRRPFESAVCGPGGVDDMSLYLLNTVQHLRITCNCPLWLLVCGTRKIKGKALWNWRWQSQENWEGKQKIYACSSLKFILEQWSHFGFPNTGPVIPDQSNGLGRQSPARQQPAPSVWKKGQNSTEISILSSWWVIWLFTSQEVSVEWWIRIA